MYTQEFDKVVKEAKAQMNAWMQVQPLIDELCDTGRWLMYLPSDHFRILN